MNVYWEAIGYAILNISLLFIGVSMAVLACLVMVKWLMENNWI